MKLFNVMILPLCGELVCHVFTGESVTQVTDEFSRIMEDTDTLVVEELA